jgi:hypothetical protein
MDIDNDKYMIFFKGIHMYVRYYDGVMLSKKNKAIIYVSYWRNYFIHIISNPDMRQECFINIETIYKLYPIETQYQKLACVRKLYGLCIFVKDQVIEIFFDCQKQREEFVALIRMVIANPIEFYDKHADSLYNELYYQSSDNKYISTFDATFRIEDNHQHLTKIKESKELKTVHNVYRDLLVNSKHLKYWMDRIKNFNMKGENDNMNANTNISYKRFKEFLYSPLNELPTQSATRSDLSYPLNYYYINSSHNTYLTGNQLTSLSSGKQYEKVLLSGCRCIEIDVWPNVKGEAIVKHGYTLTSSLSLLDVLNIIRNNAFVTSRLPLIISLELHGTPKFFTEVLLICDGVFNDLLIKYSTSHLLPSPKSLVEKILLKAKKHILNGIELPKRDMTNIGVPAPKPTILKETDHLWACISFDENVVKHLYQTQRHALQKYHSVHISRTYPKGNRFLSTNFVPIIAWESGSNMCALNWQNVDDGMRINYARFSTTNHIGYVLKPAYLLDSGNRIETKSLVSLEFIEGTYFIQNILKDTQIYLKVSIVNEYSEYRDTETFKNIFDIASPGNIIPFSQQNPVFKKQIDNSTSNFIILYIMKEKRGKLATIVSWYAFELVEYFNGIYNIPFIYGNGYKDPNAKLLVYAKYQCVNI